MAQSPFTVVDLSVERGYYFSGIIETSKDKEEKKLMYLYVALDIPIKVGDILTWRQDNGVTEKWLLLQQIHKVHPTYQTFQIIKCNYELKWIDFNGYLRKSWAYAVSSVDSKVKSNFRMWHSLISPQPNKFAEVIMPRPIFEENSEDMDRLMRGITFIIENEGWTIIECDWTSVEGIAYMSLTESKVNYEYDDRDVDVAETDRYKFPELPTLYTVGETIIPQFEAGTLNQWEIELIKPNECDFIDDNFVATGAGQCILTMRLKNRPAITKKVEIKVVPSEQEFVAYIDGPDKLRLDRQDKYSLAANVPIEGEVTFDIIEWPNMDKKPKKDYASLRQDLDINGQAIPNKYVLHANAKNNLGTIVLAATHTIKENDEIISQEIYTKTIEIVPLW